MDNLEILEQIIRKEKASIFMRLPAATEEDVKVSAALLYQRVVAPFLAELEARKPITEPVNNPLAGYTQLDLFSNEGEE